jgi:CheY-like chemotaxis protein
LLIVDNDAEGLRALATLLRGWGVEVIAVGNAHDAVAAMRRRDVSAWIFDYHLDGGDTGLALRERLIERFGERPSILISADHGPELKALVAAQEVHLLHKPVKPLALRSLLARLLG